MSLKQIEKKLKRSKKNDSHSITKKILWGIIFVNITIIALGGLLILSYINKTTDIELDIFSPNEVSRGKPFDLDVSILNSSEINFQNASLYIQLSNGLLLWSDTPQESVLSEKVGELARGNLIKKHYKIIPVGEINSRENIQISLVYFNTNNNRFEINKNIEVTITSSAFDITTSIPENIPKGSLFSFKVGHINNSGYDFSNVFLKVDFPNYYQFSKASVPYSTFDKKFNLGASLAQSKKEIEISGIFLSSNIKKSEIPLRLFVVLNNKEYLVAEKTAMFNLTEPLVSINILVNGEDDYVAKPKDHLSYEINLKNKMGVALKNVVLKVSLEGFIDSKSIKTDGYYSAQSKTITWDKTNYSSLALLEPETESNFKFELNISSAAPISLQSIVNKNLYVRAEVKLESPSLAGTLKEPFIKTAKETKVGSLIFFNAVGYRKDPLNKVESYGPFPFKANSSSSYVIHWYITNFGNDLSGAKIQAILPEGVKFIDKSAGSNIGSSPYYDTSLNSVIWELGDIYSGSGLLSGPIDGFFGLEITPSEKDIGNVIPLLGPSIFYTKDNFTKKDVSIVKDAIYSNTLYDKGNYTKVIE